MRTLNCVSHKKITAGMAEINTINCIPIIIITFQSNKSCGSDCWNSFTII